jgi:hypothetical protein
VSSKLKAVFAALTGGVGALMGGCVIGGQTIYHVDNPFQFLAHAASQGTIAVMVVGDPYPNKGDQVASVIAAAFDRTFASLGNPFRVMPAGPEKVSKIVVLFNTRHNISAHTVCDDPSEIASGTPGMGMRTSVRAIYCGDGPYSEYWMSFFAPSSPEDEKFAQLMRELALYTVPRERNPSQYY